MSGSIPVSDSERFVAEASKMQHVLDGRLGLNRNKYFCFRGLDLF